VLVYDIVNCGPRARFTVRGRNGEVFLAHNCEQIANGSVYYDEDHNWKQLHDAKIEALADIVEECNGAPVLVSYQFRHDLECLKRAFPKAVVMDQDAKVVEPWNRGEVPILLAHPESAGHGLNMARGGNVLVRFGFSWNLEHYDQILGRIGPRRQAQAGLNRRVYDHRILARATIDEDKAERIASKRSVQDVLMDAMKRRAA
jgi:SNF2 family DNA or RNA helicase